MSKEDKQTLSPSHDFPSQSQGTISPSTTPSPYNAPHLQHGHLMIHGVPDPQQFPGRELNEWWTNEHLPERLSIPGFQSASRYITSPSSTSATANPGYLVWYTTSSLSTLSSSPYLSKLDNPTPLTRHYTPYISSCTRSACRVLHRSTPTPWHALLNSASRTSRVTGGHLILLTCQPPADDDRRSQLQQDLIAHSFPEWLNLESVLSLFLLERDEAATNAGANTTSYQDTPAPATDSGSGGILDQPGEGKHPAQTKLSHPTEWTIILEFAQSLSTTALDTAAKHRFATHLAHNLQTSLVDRSNSQTVHGEVYNLICSAHS